MRIRSCAAGNATRGDAVNAFLPGGEKRGGALAPATALEDVLVARLRAAGTTIEVSREERRA